MPVGVYERRLRPVDQRFEEKVQCDPNSGCWLWTGSINNKGYGQFSYGGRCVSAHRLSLELHGQPVAANDNVLHRCDTPCCVNPAHLFTGTHQDNMADMRAKGRHTQACGEQTRSSRLTDAVVLEIRSALKRGVMQRDLAEKYGVYPSTISRINTRQQWAHLPERAR